jgi:uncharacterized protein (DUF2141 family)
MLTMHNPTLYTTLVFIDLSVEDAQSLMSGVVPGAEVILLDSRRNGVEQITAALAYRPGINRVHLVSHGAPGSLQLGATQLTLENLDATGDALGQWFSTSNSSQNPPEILLYGCRVAEGSLGRAFVQRLGQLTGAMVAASDTLTGSAALGGDWELQVRTGKMAAPLAFEPDVMADYSGVFANFVLQTGPNNPLGNITFDVGFFSTPTFADIDGDGDLDAFIGEILGTIKYYQNTGSNRSPRFSQSAANPLNEVKAGDGEFFFSTPSFADLDGDGDLDAFIGDYYGRMRYYKNNGTSKSPIFELQTEANNPFKGMVVPGNSTPTFADLDGDGDLDAVIGDWRGNLNYFQNTGRTSSLSFVQQTGSSNPFNGVVEKYYSAPTFGDVDGDGDLDLFIGSSDGTIKYYKNTGSVSSPRFVVQTGAANPFNGVDVGSYSTPSLVDIDGDGDLDALIGQFDGTIDYYKNINPVVSITPGTTPSESGPTTGTFLLTLSEAVPAGGLTVSYTVGGTATPGTDYTRLSGSVTLAEGDTEATIEVVPLPDNRVDPSETVTLTLTTTRPTTPRQGYNVGEANTAVLRIAEPVPVKQFEEQTGTANPFNGVDAGFFSTPSFADIDGDGKLDVVLGNILGQIKYYKNTGSANRPSFSEQIGGNNPFNNMKVGYFSAPSMADIDGDGDLDAFIGEYYGSIKYYKNIGSKTSPNFVEQTEANNPFNKKDVPGNSTPTFADLDGDGDLDAVIGDWRGNINYYKNIGSANRPSFSEQTGSNNPFNRVTLKYYSAPSFADINGDGDLDLFIGRNNGLIYYYENTGSISRPQFVERTGAPNPLNGLNVGSYSTPTFADINGDGYLDALSGNFNGEIKYYKNTGSSPPAPTVSSLRMTNETLVAKDDTTTTNDPLDDDTGNNPLEGGDEQDTLTGSTRKDQLSGAAGDDILLRGGIGNNQLSGGAGIDTFVLAPGEGTDTITDFMVDQDRIGLAEGLSFGQLTITQDGSDTLIKLTSDNEILAILSGVQSNTLTAADFTIL